MTISPILTQIYQEVKDPSYIIRLLDYLVNNRYDRTEFIIGTIKAVPLISGVLKCSKTNQYYYSLAQFYNNVSGNNADENDLEIFKNIYVTKKYSLWRVLCNITDDMILGFFDQKLRSFLLYRTIGKLINESDLTYSEGIIPVCWNDQEYELYPNKIDCKYTQNNKNIFELLQAFESESLSECYYLYSKDKKHLLSL